MLNSLKKLVPHFAAQQSAPADPLAGWSNRELQELLESVVRHCKNKMKDQRAFRHGLESQLEENPTGEFLNLKKNITETTHFLDLEASIINTDLNDGMRYDDDFLRRKISDLHSRLGDYSEAITKARSALMDAEYREKVADCLSEMLVN